MGEIGILACMTDTPPRDYERLAKLARARRAELGLAITAVAKEAGMSKDTYKRLENGMRIWDLKYSQVDSALGWASGSCLAILEGSDPRQSAEDAEGAEVVTHKLDPEDFDHAFVSAMIATKGDLTGNEIRELSNRVIAELKRRGVL